MKTYQKAFALIEVMIVLCIFGIFVSILAAAFMNNPGATEERAKESAHGWLTSNNIAPKRFSCAHDSDGDGYGSCTVVTQTDEKIYLQCVSGWFQKLTGASSCKEVDTLIKISAPRR